MADGSELKSPKRWSALFKAEYLHALEPMIRRSQALWDRPTVRGLIIEPCAAGGVLLVSTDGVCLTAIRDPDGRASERARVYIPDRIFAAVAPPAGVPMWSEGESWNEPLPEWAQPGQVYLWQLAAFVLPKMHRPGDDGEDHPLLGQASLEEGNVHSGGYRVFHDENPLPWRKVFAKYAPAETGFVGLDRDVLGIFSRVADLFAENGSYGLLITMGEPGGALRVQVKNAPDFVGLVMPLKYTKAEDGFAAPEWTAMPVEAAAE
jgi:hypothetical protein